MTIIDVSVKNNVFNDKYAFTEVSKLLKSGYTHVKKINDTVKAINFTREAFQRNIWTRETIKARGLFVNEKEEVVARGFEKFFNLNQVLETQEDVIIKKLNTALKEKKTIKINEKLDGFLTIVSYSPDTNGLFITSKGGGVDYSNLAKHVLTKTLGRAHLGPFNPMEYLSNYLKDEYEKGNKYSIIFEIIAPKYDCHLIKYTDIHSVCLTVINNDLSYQGEPDIYKEVVEKFKFEIPKNFDYTLFLEQGKFTNKVFEEMKTNQDIEGYVIYVDEKPIVKVKTYRFLKRKEFRSCLNRFVRINKRYILQIISNDKRIEDINKLLNGITNNRIRNSINKIYTDNFKLKSENIAEDNGWHVDLKLALDIPQIIEKYNLSL